MKIQVSCFLRCIRQFSEGELVKIVNERASVLSSINEKIARPAVIPTDVVRSMIDGGDCFELSSFADPLFLRFFSAAAASDTTHRKFDARGGAAFFDDAWLSRAAAASSFESLATEVRVFSFEASSVKPDGAASSSPWPVWSFSEGENSCLLIGMTPGRDDIDSSFSNLR